MGQAPVHRPTSLPLGTAGLAQRVLKPDRHAALPNGSRRGQKLANRGQSQGVQPQEGHRGRTGKGSLRHVEISRDGYVVAPIIGGPRPLPGVTTRPTYTSISPAYRTLKREEPLNVAPESCEKL